MAHQVVYSAGIYPQPLVVQLPWFVLSVLFLAVNVTLMFVVDRLRRKILRLRLFFFVFPSE